MRTQTHRPFIYQLVLFQSQTGCRSIMRPMRRPTNNWCPRTPLSRHGHRHLYKHLYQHRYLYQHHSTHQRVLPGGTI